jgi:hypothetical protein
MAPDEPDEATLAQADRDAYAMLNRMMHESATPDEPDEATLAQADRDAYAMLNRMMHESATPDERLARIRAEIARLQAFELMLLEATTVSPGMLLEAMETASPGNRSEGFHAVPAREV